MFWGRPLYQMRQTQRALCLWGPEKGSAIKSTEPEARSPTDLLIYSRILAENLDRIGSLESENSQLLKALRATREQPDCRPEEHTNIIDILDKVPTCISPFYEIQRFLRSMKYSTQEEHGSGLDSSSKSQTKTKPSTIPQTSTAHGPARASEATGENRARSSVGSPGKQGELPERHPPDLYVR